MGTETSGPDKQYMMPGKNEHPDATPANKPDSVDDKLSGKHPDGRQNINYEICESYPDVPGLAPQAEKSPTEEPGDTITSPPCPLIDCRSATANTATLVTVPSNRTMPGLSLTVPIPGQLSTSHPAETPQ